VETDLRARPADLRACPAGPRTLAGRPRAGDRDAETGRARIPRPGWPGIAAAVSHVIFSSDVNITGAWRYAADPFGAISFTRIEIDLTGIAGRSGNPGGNFRRMCRPIPGAMAPNRAGELKRVAIARPKAGGAEVRW